MGIEELNRKIEEFISKMNEEIRSNGAMHPKVSCNTFMSSGCYAIDGAKILTGKVRMLKKAIEVESKRIK
ncbi:hypothetical protein RND71_008141 [Anisodus tanguticus]|uniref:Uncharacterized protein n=1 Tax=Anisodus tanguticus TaxID=243964 RepID=A0AAE1VKR5_9SOLA|nr:hypothetical protein RND71_008141 [Anisodus tanguticus]